MTKEEAIKRFETLLLHIDTDCVMGTETTEAINMAIKALEQPERKTGEWIPLISTSDLKHHEWCGYQCSICGERTLRLTQYNFCPNCGSYNGGEQDG